MDVNLFQYTVKRNRVVRGTMILCRRSQVRIPVQPAITRTLFLFNHAVSGYFFKLGWDEVCER